MRAAICFLLVGLGLPGLLSAQSAQDAIRAFAGKQVILVRRGGDGTIKLDRSKLDKISGSCDMAVSVERADLEKGQVRFLLESIGTPELSNRPRNFCPRAEPTMELQISGFAVDDTSDQVAASMRKILQTPEEYLAANGIAFDLPPRSDDEVASHPPPEMTHPVLLLRVDGTYSERARKSRIGGSVTIRLTVGTDGRTHNARIAKGLGSGLDENALRALSMWRFEPGRQADHAVASNATMQMSFRIL